MAFGGGEVHKAAYAQQVDFAAILEFVFIHKGTNFTLAAGELLEGGDVNLDIEVAGVAHNRAALHFFEMLGANHALVSGHSDENIAFLHRFRHRHHAEAVHHCFNTLHWVDFGDDDIRSQSFCAHGYAASAPAVTRDHNFEASKQHVR